MFQEIRDLAAAQAISPLLERGRSMYRAHQNSLPRNLQRIGSSMDIVVASDFVENAMLCLRHVSRNGCSLHILCDDGSLCSMLERLNWDRS